MNQPSGGRVSSAKQVSKPFSTFNPSPLVMASRPDACWAPPPVGFRPEPFLGALNAALRNMPDLRNAGTSWLRLPGSELGEVRVAVGHDPDGRVSHSIFWNRVRSVAAKVSRGAARKMNLQTRSHA